jgi:hypothetical protein
VVDLYSDFSSVVPVERASVLSGDKSYRGKIQEALFLVGSAWKDHDLEGIPKTATTRAITHSRGAKEAAE